MWEGRCVLKRHAWVQVRLLSVPELLPQQSCSWRAEDRPVAFCCRAGTALAYFLKEVQESELKF